MKKISLFLAIATLIFTSCKEGANKPQGDGTFKFDKETTGSYLADTIFVDGPAIVINPYTIDKDMDGKDINEVERELVALKKELDAKYRNEHYSVFIAKQNYVKFINPESGLESITYYPFNRYNRMVVMMPGRGAKSFETWKELEEVENLIHPKVENTPADKESMEKEAKEKEQMESKKDEGESEGGLKEIK